MMKKIKIIGAASVIALLAACSQSGFDTFLSDMKSGTKAAVDLNNALVQINITIIDNLIKQEKLLAPYQCGAVALGSAIIKDSTAAKSVNNYLAKNVAANVTYVAVKDICAAAGYPTNVTAAPTSGG